MKFNENFTITEEPYGIRLYDVYIKITVSSRVHGRPLSIEEVRADKELMELLNRYLIDKLKGSRRG